MRAALLLLFALLALAGCRDQRQQLGQALSGKPPVIAGSLEGEWQIEDLNGGGPVAQSRLMFDPGDQGTSRLSGTAGCNRFSGNWKQDGATLQLGPMAATRMDRRRHGAACFVSRPTSGSRRSLRAFRSTADLPTTTSTAPSPTRGCWPPAA
jgi:heat shock protein HslJ